VLLTIFNHEWTLIDTNENEPRFCELPFRNSCAFVVIASTVFRENL
jgi:hypothetical protein